jgi:uncharacterized RDD family membrane protein YckC
MPDEGYEIRCNKCRSPVSSKAMSCPHCGAVLQDRVNRALEPQPSALLGSVASGPTSTGLRTWESPPPPPPLSLPSLGSAHFSYGGFWIRTLAALIDSLILGVAAFFLRPRLGEIAPLITFVGNWLYFSLMESSGSQATVGKVVCGLRVTDTQGQRISFGRATGRYFAKVLSALTLFIGYLMVGWTRQKRGLHDFIAGTLVVRALPPPASATLP